MKKPTGMKAKKGWLSVEVGLVEEEEGHAGELERFLIPISHLYHPLFRQLLDRSQEVYGYASNGPLRLPCSVDDFLRLRWQIDSKQLIHHLLRCSGALSTHG